MNLITEPAARSGVLADEGIPFVSILIITYNQAHLIGETLDSVLAQDYPRMEIVVGDDGSTDGTDRILQEYASRHPGVVIPILNEKNLGITANCNQTLNACRGELVAILGGDDLFLPGKISAQVRPFIEDPAVVLAYHPVEIFESASGRTIYTTNLSPGEDTANALEMISKIGIPGASSVMVRRSACPAWGFEPSLPTVSDWIFYVEVALKGKVVKINQILGRYRKHGMGVSNRSLDLLEESLRTLTILQERYPEVPGMAEACRVGEARYLAGEAFRQLAKDPALARRLADRALKLTPGDRRLVLLARVASLGPVGRWIGKGLNLTKYLIKARIT